MFMFQFKIFGVSIEIMCAQKNVRQTALAVNMRKKQLDQDLPHSQSLPARSNRTACHPGNARRVKTSKDSGANRNS
jgi:hypothetical protein